MHGRQGFILFFLLLTLSSCASKKLLQADCHSCTSEDKEWQDFPFASLTGSWRGSLEFTKNEAGKPKRVKNEKRAELRFISASVFMSARPGVACQSIPAEAVVLNGLLWGDTKAKVFDAFVPDEDGLVAYGRLSFEKMNGQEVCQFQRLGRVMGTNRLGLPIASFSETKSARALASVTGESEVSVEFLRFAPGTVKKLAFAGDSRAPAATEEKEKPPLMIRVVRVQTMPPAAKGRGSWTATEESLYRLWKVE